MSLFRKRLQKPNQLETMRKIVEEVDLGKVHNHFHACLINANSTLQEHLSFTGMAPSADAGAVGGCRPRMLFCSVHPPAAPETMHVQVLLTGDGFAVIEGLNNDAPIGCSLKFVSGSSGVLLWRRSDNIVYALILGRQGAVEEGEAVECRIRAILQARAVDAFSNIPARMLWSDKHVPCLVGKTTLNGKIHRLKGHVTGFWTIKETS